MNLEIKRLCKTFKNQDSEKTVFKDLNLKVSTGEFVCLLGNSGCGKTTLLNIIAGFVKITSGSVLLNGREINSIGTDRVMLFQESSLFPWLNVIDNIEFGLKMTGMNRSERHKKATEILDAVHLTGNENLYIHQLSGGMKQRVALARALVMDSQLLLMDEPFSALDHYTREKLRTELLRIWKEYGKTVLFVTHDVEEAVLLADRILVFSPVPGRIVKDVPIGIDRNERAGNDRILKIAAEIKEEYGLSAES
ncbi:MAG: ABC transporter ATP-binding protein [Bacteroidota bacterium]